MVLSSWHSTVKTVRGQSLVQLTRQMSKGTPVGSIHIPWDRNIVPVHHLATAGHNMFAGV